MGDAGREVDIMCAGCDDAARRSGAGPRKSGYTRASELVSGRVARDWKRTLESQLTVVMGSSVFRCSEIARFVALQWFHISNDHVIPSLS